MLLHKKLITNLKLNKLKAILKRCVLSLDGDDDYDGFDDDDDCDDGSDREI